LLSVLDASTTADLERAVQQLQAAVSLYPESKEAWESLAHTYERLGDWEKAFDTWNSILVRAGDQKEQDIANTSLQRVNDERILCRLNGGVEAAANEQYEKALSILVEAANLSSSDGIRNRIRNQYYDIYTATLRARLLNEGKSRGWRSAGAAALSKGPASDGYALRDRICASFGDSDPFRIKVLSISGRGLSLLREGQYERLSEEDKDAISKAQTDAIVFVIIDEQVSSYAFDVKQEETVPILDSASVGFVPGLPVNMSAWSCLPEKRHTNSGFYTEVWTQKTQYHVGDQVTFYLRSNVACYVTLVAVQSNDDLVILLPNSHWRNNSIEANTIFTLPPPGEEHLTIQAQEPAGVHGIKLIASTKPIPIAGLAHVDGFGVARTPAEQQELCDSLAQFVNALADDAWDVSTWTFEIGGSK